MFDRGSNNFSGLVYPTVAHWAWSSEGWLAQGVEISYNNDTVVISYRDFAGSGVVHLLGKYQYAV